jgi:hypothetical protein
VAAQPPDNLQAFFYRGPEVSRPQDRVALVQVVGFNPDFEKALHQRFHGGHIIVHPGEKNRLAPQGNPCIRQTLARLAHFRSQFLRMGEMDAHPEGMEFLQHPGQSRGDSLRKDHRRLGSDPQELHMTDLAQTRKKPSQALVRKGQGIPS